MTIPYTFAGATTAIPLAQLDSNFASPITLGNVAMTLSNTYTSIGNLTLTNVTISSASGLAANTVAYANASGVLGGSANMTFDGSTLTTLNSAYTGTLTGGTGIVNLGSGQFYKDASGNVGIGTSSPLGILDVVKAGNQDMRIRSSNTGEAAIRFQNTTSGTTTSDGLYVGLSGSDGYLYNYESANLIFGTSSAERMRIDSSGNVGINYATPQGKFEVNSGTTPNIAHFLIGYGGSNNYMDANANIFRTGNYVETMRNNAYGLGLGGAIPTSGTGISFPATQSASSDANTLDDYEEGTFTPTVSLGTLTNSKGYYRKIGSQLTVWGVIGGFSDRTTVSSIVLNNLPFASKGSTDVCSGAVFGRYISVLTSLSSYVDANVTNMYFYNVSTSGYTTLNHNNLNNASSELYFMGTYITN